MTVVLDIAEPQRETFVEFLKTLPYVTIISDESAVDNSDFWEQLSDDQRASIQRGLADADAGRMKPLRQVLEKYR